MSGVYTKSDIQYKEMILIPRIRVGYGCTMRGLIM